MTQLVEVEKDFIEANDRVQSTARRIMLDVIDYSGLTKGEIARRAHRSRPQVNMMLSSDSSINLRTLVHFLHAAGYRLQLEAVPIRGDGPTFS